MNRSPARYAAGLKPLLTSLLAIAVALILGGIFLELTGKDALNAYRILLAEGLGDADGRTETLKRMAPLLIVSGGLLIALRGGVWNIGVDGQFLVGALAAATVGAELAGTVPDWLMWLLAAVAGIVAGLFWALPPALMKTRLGLNEIITTLMMNYVAIYLTAWLVKGPLRDESLSSAQTRPIPAAHRLANIPGTEIHIGLLVGLLVVALVAGFFRYTAPGLMLTIMGMNRRAAFHAGVPVMGLTLFALLISGSLAGLAGTNDVLSVQGVFRNNWNPGYGLTAFALVYLARFRSLLLIPFAFFFSFLLVGGELMPRRADIPTYFVEMLEGLVLVCFAAGLALERRWFRPSLPNRLGETDGLMEPGIPT